MVAMSQMLEMGIPKTNRVDIVTQDIAIVKDY